MWDLFRIAARNVLRNRRRSGLTLGAIFFAVLVMLSVRGLLNGLQASIRDIVVRGGVGALAVHRAGYLRQVLGAPLALDIPADEAFLQLVRRSPHVVAAAARIHFGAMVNAGDTTVLAVVSAVDPAHEDAVSPLRRDDIVRGGPMSVGDPSGAVLAEALARRLRLAPGGRAALLAADRDGVLNGADILVVGLLGQARLPGAEARVALVPLALAQDLLRMPGRATEIGVAIDDLEHLEAARAAVAGRLGPVYEVSTWRDLGAVVDDLVRTQNAVLSVIVGVFLVVALIGIANTMLMNVLERTREIGTMMAVGVRRRQILALVLVEAAVLGAVGAAAGAIGANALVSALGRRGLDFRIPTGAVQHLVPHLTARYTVAIVAVAALGAVIAALYPALRASRMRPAEALTRV